jgi:hypothetical protein
LTEFGGEIQVPFELPFAVDHNDDDAVRRLNQMLWAGCMTRVACSRPIR